LLLLLRRREQIRTRSYITADALVDKSQIEWNTFYEKANDNNFVAALSITRDGFEYLLELFRKEYSCKSDPGRKGRPNIPASTALALLLTFYRDQCGLTFLGKLFGMTSSTVSWILNKSERALLKVPSVLPESAIRWPTFEEQRNCALAVERKYPGIVGRWGFVDGKNYRVEKPTNALLQNAMFNGWLQQTFVTGVFCFAADGTVVWGKHNVAGS
jgi:hypothetical protein